MSISKTIVGVAAFAACLLSAGSVLAVEAVAKSAVNVRTGPGTSFGIVDQLTAGEVVNVTECAPSNFCFVEHNGPDGWVSANYLTALGACPINSRFFCWRGKRESDSVLSHEQDIPRLED